MKNVLLGIFPLHLSLSTCMHDKAGYFDAGGVQVDLNDGKQKKKHLFLALQPLTID